TKAQGSDSDYSPWKTDEPAMWLKSAIRQLQKWVPTSAEYIREQLRAVRDVAAETPQPAVPPPPGVDAATGEIVDGELVDVFPDEAKP
ncbi:MAG: recombinase RecT, partial [Gammaproteobacteria bacterium]